MVLENNRDVSEKRVLEELVEYLKNNQRGKGVMFTNVKGVATTKKHDFFHPDIDLLYITPEEGKNVEKRVIGFEVKAMREEGAQNLLYKGIGQAVMNLHKVDESYLVLPNLKLAHYRKLFGDDSLIGYFSWKEGDTIPAPKNPIGRPPKKNKVLRAAKKGRSQGRLLCGERIEL